jgi:hypothetical protein
MLQAKRAMAARVDGIFLMGLLQFDPVRRPCYRRLGLGLGIEVLRWEAFLVWMPKADPYQLSETELP